MGPSLCRINSTFPIICPISRQATTVGHVIRNSDATQRIQGVNDLKEQSPVQQQLLLARQSCQEAGIALAELGW